MSYCRFSCDDFQSNVYCYEDVHGGFTTHVAVNRPILDGTLPPPVAFDEDHLEEYMARHKKVMDWIENAQRELLGLPYDGESFNDPTASDAADRLQMLKDAGYHVPQYAIDNLRTESCWKPK